MPLPSDVSDLTTDVSHYASFFRVVSPSLPLRGRASEVTQLLRYNMSSQGLRIS